MTWYRFTVFLLNERAALEAARPGESLKHARNGPADYLHGDIEQFTEPGAIEAAKDLFMQQHPWSEYPVLRDHLGVKLIPTPLTTPRDIYESPEVDGGWTPPAREILQRHMNELDSTWYAIPHERDDEIAQRLTVKIHAYKDYDGSRYARLASVWFDGKPFLIVRNAGRGGADFCDRLISDMEVYGQVLRFVLSFVDTTNTLTYQIAGMDESVPSLWEFYNSDFTPKVGMS